MEASACPPDSCFEKIPSSQVCLSILKHLSIPRCLYTALIPEDIPAPFPPPLPHPLAFPWVWAGSAMGSPEGKQWGTLQVSIIPSLSFEQAAVGLDLVLQSGLNVQELLVLGVLALGLSPNLLQLFLQGGDLALDLGELHAVATFCFCQGGFQRLFLKRRVLLSAVKYGKFFSKTSSQKGSG